MELSRQEYPALLATLQPSQATTVLNDRIKLINKVNSDIADWLQERRRVEDAYAQGLRKLAHRVQFDNAALGIFQIPWQRIMSATETLAVSHETLATKIEEDVERPLREYSSRNQEMQSMSGVQNNLSALAKNVDSAQKKVEKTKEKGSKGADKLAGAIVAADEVNQQWDSRAPFVFEQLQACDESRLNHLRDVLTQLETHQADQVEKARQAAESCLNVLLNVETADEIKTFAARMSGNRAPISPALSRRQPEPAPGAETPPVSTASAQTPTAAVPLAPPPLIQDDSASQRSERSERVGVAATPPAPEPQQRHTPLGGLRRLGTVMGRRKSVVGSSGGSFDKKVEKKHRSPFASFKRNDSSREMQIPESPPPSTADRPATSLTGSGSVRNPSVSHDRDMSGTVVSVPVAQGSTATNGAVAPESAGLVSSDTNQSRVDSEGFSERPSTIDEITRAQREAAGAEDIGMNLTIRDQPIFEDESQAKRAMDDMANTLRMQAHQTGLRRNAGTIRGRRDVRNTVFIPNPTTEIPATLATPEMKPPTSPIKHSASPSNATDDHAVSDTTSVRSGHTLHGPGPAVHPELHEAGLNASIIETVNAWFSEGTVTKSFVVGELALAHNATPDAATDNMRIRLDNFQVLEKVAANPHFVQDTSKDVSEDQRGEYEIQLGSISRPMPTVAFKYQVHLDASNSSAYCPVIFKPAWNLEEYQASAIIFYSLNPSFTLPATDSLVITNLILSVSLDTASEDESTKQPRDSVAHATSAAMYPNSGATFRRKHSTVTWKLPELEIKAPGTAGADSKFLVRFATATSGPRKGNVETKFELRSPEAGSRLGISRAAPDSFVSQQEPDPFADEGSSSQQHGTHPSATTPVTWHAVPTARKLVAGKYVSS